MLSLLLFFIGTIGSTLAYSPAFLWSPRASTNAAPEVEHLGAVSGRDVEHIASLLGSKVELRLVFLAEGLSTEAVRQHGSRLPALNRLLQTSASSLTMPFTTAHDSSLFASAVHVPAAQAVAYFKTHASTLFANGALDTIVIDLQAPGASTEAQLESHDALIDRVTGVVDAATKGNYAALLTASRGAIPRPSHRRLASAPKVAYLHTTPTLLTAQLVMLILMIIFLSGFCCLFSLQVGRPPPMPTLPHTTPLVILKQSLSPMLRPLRPTSYAQTPKNFVVDKDHAH